MSIWKDNTAARLAPTPAPIPEAKDAGRVDAPAKAEPSPPSPTLVPAARTDSTASRKESIIASDITIEGKIEGGGSVRIAGKFKGNVNVQGDLTIEIGAKLSGSVRAERVTIAGELEGNVEEAAVVDLQKTGVVNGDLKAGSLTVAAGARLRGQAEFGWDDGKGPKPAKYANGHGAENGGT
jgi:cytoskeletal protein CcmA (bactofilin family)